MVSLHIDTAESWRGGQNQVLLTVRGLQARGHRVLLVAHARGELRRRATGVPVVPLGVRGEFDVPDAWRLARLIRRERPDVVHAHDPHGLALAALARLFGGRRHRPALAASRRVDFHVGGNLLSRRKYRQVDLFIAASDAIRRMLIDDGIPPEATVTVHEGVEIDRLRAVPPSDVRRLLSLAPGTPIVGNVAALVPHKGQAHLIEAARLVLDRVPDAHVVIVGEGELRQPLLSRIRALDLEGRVTLAGFRQDVIALVKTFDVFVMSSISEGLGTSLLDAMVAGLPVVATDAGGIPEVVETGVTGFVVPVADVGTLADRIVRLLADAQLRRRMGEAGLARVRERFSAARMVDETAAAYRTARDRSQRGGTRRPRPRT